MEAIQIQSSLAALLFPFESSLLMFLIKQQQQQAEAELICSAWTWS